MNKSSNCYCVIILIAGNYSNFSIISAGCTSIDATTKTVSLSQATQNITTSITSGRVVILAKQTNTDINQISDAPATYKAGQSITLLLGFQEVIDIGCNNSNFTNFL